MKFSPKPETFSQVFLHFWNIYQILDILKKKMRIIADLFQKFKDCQKSSYLNA